MVHSLTQTARHWGMTDIQEGRKGWLVLFHFFYGQSLHYLCTYLERNPKCHSLFLLHTKAIFTSTSYFLQLESWFKTTQSGEIRQFFQ